MSHLLSLFKIFFSLKRGSVTIFVAPFLKRETNQDTVGFEFFDFALYRCTTRNQFFLIVTLIFLQGLGWLIVALYTCFGRFFLLKQGKNFLPSNPLYSLWLSGALNLSLCSQLNTPFLAQLLKTCTFGYCVRWNTFWPVMYFRINLHADPNPESKKLNTNTK